MKACLVANDDDDDDDVDCSKINIYQNTQLDLTLPLR
jgi:hypothetical protein